MKKLMDMISRTRKSVEDARTKYTKEVDKAPKALDGSLR